MTRINVVPVEELSDQHLLAEYHELPRVIKQYCYTGLAPRKYILGKGHVKWARRHMHYVLSRYKELWDEIKYRGFKLNYPYEELADYTSKNVIGWPFYLDYTPTPKDFYINIDRLVEKYKLKPSFYKWTKRNKPDYYDYKC